MPFRVVQIQARQRGVGFAVKVRPEKLYLSKKNRHQVRWRVTGSHVVVRFRKSPFTRRSFQIRRGGSRNSGRIRSRAKLGSYKYSIYISNRLVRDPQIIIR